MIQSARWNGFWAGWLVCVALRSLHQDMQGKDLYLHNAAQGWWPWYVTVPIALLMLFAARLWMRDAEQIEGAS